MKKYVVMLILFMLISLSGAVSEKKADQQVGYNFGGLKLNQVIDPSGSATTVNIKDNSFQPSVLNVPIGATVEWHNQDGVQHTVTSDIQGLFDSGVLMPGKKFAFKFNAPGSFGYHCSIHQGMQGDDHCNRNCRFAGFAILGIGKDRLEGSRICILERKATQPQWADDVCGFAV